MNSRALFIALFCVCVVGRCQGTEDDPSLLITSPSPTTEPTLPDTEPTLPDTEPTLPDTTSSGRSTRIETHVPHPTYPTHTRIYGHRYPWKRYHPWIGSRKNNYGDWSRSSPGPHPTAAVYPYNSFWRRNFTSSPSENSTYPYTDWPTGTDEPERNFNTETTQATASKTNNTTDYDVFRYWGVYATPDTPFSVVDKNHLHSRPQSDRVLVEMPGSLATDQDLHFVMSLVPMLRQRSLRDKLDLQVEVLNLFRSKVSYD
ncbi:uncharacterized protein isoform X4 [Choristoneura fumiferana]|uniref:uncharacterized protein isoform X2 n=1 Tax=Choristoneura fumiferana TaxID=7141 RepID=UPI003D157F17